jgi:hypothetical protein
VAACLNGSDAQITGMGAQIAAISFFLFFI